MLKEMVRNKVIRYSIPMWQVCPVTTQIGHTTLAGYFVYIDPADLGEDTLEGTLAAANVQSKFAHSLLHTPNPGSACQCLVQPVATKGSIASVTPAEG